MANEDDHTTARRRPVRQNSRVAASIGSDVGGYAELSGVRTVAAPARRRQAVGVEPVDPVMVGVEQGEQAEDQQGTRPFTF